MLIMAPSIRLGCLEAVFKKCQNDLEMTEELRRAEWEKLYCIAYKQLDVAASVYKR